MILILIFQEGSEINDGYEEDSSGETSRVEEQVNNFLNLHPVMFHLVWKPNRVPNRNDLMSMMYINFDPNGWPSKRSENHPLLNQELST